MTTDFECVVLTATNKTVPVNLCPYSSTFQDTGEVLCSVDRASLYNLVNETNLVHNILCIFRQFYL